MNYYKHPTALISSSAKIGDNTRIWAFTNIQDDVIIGENCNICDACFVEKGVSIGAHVTLKNNVSVFEGITLEDDVFVGGNTSFINDRHPRSHRNDPWVLEKTLVKKGATIGSNATILCGITIGEYAFVAAGCVVTKDIPVHAIVVGNPAELKGYACCCGRKLNDNLICSCGLKYSLHGKELKINE